MVTKSLALFAVSGCSPRRRTFRTVTESQTQMLDNVRRRHVTVDQPKPLLRIKQSTARIFLEVFMKASQKTAKDVGARLSRCCVRVTV